MRYEKTIFKTNEDYKWLALKRNCFPVFTDNEEVPRGLSKAPPLSLKLNMKMVQRSPIVA